MAPYDISIFRWFLGAVLRKWNMVHGDHLILESSVVTSNFLAQFSWSCVYVFQNFVEEKREVGCWACCGRPSAQAGIPCALLCRKPVIFIGCGDAGGKTTCVVCVACRCIAQDERNVSNRTNTRFTKNIKPLSARDTNGQVNLDLCSPLEMFVSRWVSPSAVVFPPLGVPSS